MLPYPSRLLHLGWLKALPLGGPPPSLPVENKPYQGRPKPSTKKKPKK